MSNSQEAVAQAAVDALIQRVTEQIDELSFDDTNQAVLTQLVESFADPRGMVRLRIASLLGEIGEPATPLLTQALASHENPVVRRACAKTLTLIGDPSAIPVLIQAALKDEDTVVRGSAVGALARTGEAAVPELIKILAATDTSESMKGHAAWALAFIGAEAKHLLYQALTTDNIEVRSAVVGAIAKVTQEDPNPNNFEILINALTDPAPVVRSEAAAALGNLGHLPALPHLLALLTHDLWETRKSAALALMKMGDLTALAPLQAAMAQDPETGSQAIYQLAISQLQKQASANDWG